MRLSQTDRRKLNDILRSRITKLKGRLPCSSLLLALTLNIWLSPAAYARLEEDAVDFTFEKTYSENAPDGFTNYSLDELRQENPTAARNEQDIFADQIVSLINAIGDTKGSQKLKKHRSSQQSKEDYFNRAAVALDHGNHDSNADPDAIRETIGKEGVDAVAQDSLKNTALWKRVQQGLDFKLDFAAFFRSRKQVETAEPDKGRVRYGLILKDIKPDNSLSRSRAAVGTTLMEDEMAYAGTAEVEWTIGPITGDAGPSAAVKRARRNGSASSKEDREALRQYQNELHEDDETNDNPVIDESVDTDASVWQTGVSSSFGGNARPAGGTSTPDLANSKTPGLQITLTQEQGLYEYMTQLGKADKNTSEHRFKIPVIGTLSVGRRYNDKMEVISTSAHNILVTKRLPSVSIHYYENTGQYKADAEHDVNGYAISAAVRGDAEKVTEKQKQKKKHQRGYELGVSKRF